jgi:hypothetical protein
MPDASHAEKHETIVRAPARPGRLGVLDVRRALLEGLAVLVGILVAFGIDAWWDVRSEEGRALAYQSALLDEVRANQRLIQQADTLGYRFDVEAAAGYFESIVYAAAPVSEDAVREMLWDAGTVAPLEYGRGALSDLLSSGGLAAIDDASVRRAITNYDVALTLEAAAQARVDEAWWDDLVPYASRHMGLDDIFPDVFVREYLQAPGMLAGRFPVDVEGFRQNREWANHLTSLVYLGRELERERADLVVAMQRLEAALVEVLEGRGPT